MNDNLTKLNLGFKGSKLLRTKFNWKFKKLNEEVTKMGGKTYITWKRVTDNWDAVQYDFKHVTTEFLHGK